MPNLESLAPGFRLSSMWAFDCRYDRAVRYILIALLVAFLPLRGWVGDSMAAQMATATVVQHNAADRAAAAHGAATEMSQDEHAASGIGDVAAAGDCVDHAASMATTSSGASHCQSCVVCQACSSVALLLPSADGDISLPRLDVLRLPAPRFTSADRALGLKPPIS